MELLSDHTVRVVAAGAAILGGTAGALGSFALLRRQSLLGDALSHAALPGIVTVYLLTGSKAPLPIMLGAAVAGWLGTLCVRAVVGRSRIPYDAALGMLLSVFFGFGLVLLTSLQKRPDAGQAGLDSFLFGQAAALLERDVAVMSALAAVALATLALTWKEVKLLAFDPEFGTSLGLPMRRLDTLLGVLLVIAVVIGLQTVGVVLMSAMLVAPAAAARQWTARLLPMVLLAAGLGLSGGVVGATLSSRTARLPTGPTIVLVLSLVVILSLAFAPERGLVWRWRRLRRLRATPELEPVLLHLHALSLQHGAEPEHGHGLAVLRSMSPRRFDVETSLAALERRGLARRDQAGRWAPTPLGRREAQRVLERGEQADGAV